MSKPSTKEQATALTLPRVGTRCVALDPYAWGYADRAVMEAAFAARFAESASLDLSVIPGAGIDEIRAGMPELRRLDAAPEDHHRPPHHDERAVPSRYS